MKIRILKAYDSFNDCMYFREQYKSLYRFLRALYRAWRGGNGLIITVKIDA